MGRRFELINDLADHAYVVVGRHWGVDVINGYFPQGASAK
jgi:hypothetical protein